MFKHFIHPCQPCILYSARVTSQVTISNDVLTFYPSLLALYSIFWRENIFLIINIPKLFLIVWPTVNIYSRSVDKLFQDKSFAIRLFSVLMYNQRGNRALPGNNIFSIKVDTLDIGFLNQAKNIPVVLTSLPVIS